MSIFNHEVFEKDPLKIALLNNGVAQVSPDEAEDSEVLRFEMQTFVCRGEYESGSRRILDSFLEKLRSSSPQPCGWISGFYGSGKSHLCKMLKVLWSDYRFPDGAAARSLIHNLPDSVGDLLTELHNEVKKAGGAHAAAGTLGASSSDNVRSALLSIVFRSVGLPAQVHQARFILWLKAQGLYEQVRHHVEAKGKNFEDELRRLYVSTLIAEALLKADPNYGDAAQVRKLLMESFKQVKDIDNDEMVDDINRALSIGGKFPLTLIVLDEVQQYIGNDEQRAYQVQEVAEVCQSRFGSKLLLIATGQAAMGATPMLQKLKGRFPLAVVLGDKDVEEVVRETLLAKNVKFRAKLKAVLDANIGEISRHLAGSAIGHTAGDEEVLIADYPILPVRRRFWERVLRATDVSGVVSQLRNQLRIAYEALRDTARQPLGHVVPADLIFDQLRESLILGSLIGREVYDQIRRLDEGSDEDKQKARLLKLIYLINRLPIETVADAGIRATVDTLADLILTDLKAGSAELRKRIPGLLDELVQSALVMGMSDGGHTVYRLQTVESTAWYSEFREKESGLRHNTPLLEQKRAERVKTELQVVLKKVRLAQGTLKEPRHFSTCFDPNLPADHGERMYLWVQDGWDNDERHVIASAKSVGLADPTVFLFLPARDKSDLHSAIVAKEAAEFTIGSRGTPTTPEGQDAKKMMEMKAAQAEEQIQRILNAAFAEATVFMGGGTKIDSGSTLEERLQAAGQAALARLYKYFEKADAVDKSLWTKVIEKAKQRATDALVVLGHEAEPDKHPVCADILSFLGTTGRRGAEVQDKFESPPYGWPRDAIQAALMALLAAGYLRAKDAAGNPIEALRLERNKITQTHFATEKIKLTAPQLIAVKGTLKALGISCNQGEEQAKALEAASRLRALRDAAGGDAPLPEKPSTALIEALEARSGNDLLLELCNHKTEIEKAANEWKTTAEEIAQRKPGWDQVTQLLNVAQTLPGAKALGEKIAEVEAQRALLDNPNPVSPIAQGLTELLRTVLNEAVAAFGAAYDDEMAALAADADWRRLYRTEQQSILENEGLNGKLSADSRSAESILTGLARCDLTRWQERIHALPARFDAVRQKVAQALEIKPVTVKLPRRILRTETDVRVWLTDVEGTLLAKVAEAPIQL